MGGEQGYSFSDSAAKRLRRAYSAANGNRRVHMQLHGTWVTVRSAWTGPPRCATDGRRRSRPANRAGLGGTGMKEDLMDRQAERKGAEPDRRGGGGEVS